MKAAQQSARQEIDSRCNKDLACLDAKVKIIIQDTVKSQSITKKAILLDSSLLECELILTTADVQPFSQPSSKSFKQHETIDLRRPANYRKPKKQDA